MNYANVVSLSPRGRPAQSPLDDAEADSWGTILSVDFPGRASRHPRVLDLVEEQLGRICAVDTGGTGVTISFLAKGDSYTEARQDSREVALHLLSLLKLPAETHVQIDLVEPGVGDQRATEATVQSFPDLR